MVKCPGASYNATVMVSPVESSKRQVFGTVLILMVVLILLAYALRLLNLDAFSFWTDEGLTPLRSGYPLSEILSNRIIIQDGVTKDTHPPLYYLIIHFTQQLFGDSDFAYRYPSLLAGVLLVPLLFQFGRRLQSITAGLIAALFTAVSPLQIYYGNEARMYAIFVLLAAGASYVLWRALSGADLRRSMLLYVVLAALALYTHYTAVFLIAVQALFWLWLLWREGYKRLIVILGILALFLAIPVIPFTVPRMLGGAEANYYYVQPTVMLLDVLRFFSLGLTVDFKETLVSIVLVTSLILSLVGLWSAGTWLKRLFLLGYLLAVVFGLMAGSLVKPMYQGVRHIMAGSPAFILLLAMGADYLLQSRQQFGERRRIVTRMVGIILMLAPLLGSFYALNNFYNDPAFAKDDFRSMIQYIEGRAGKNDVVLYHNAILLPLHEHYRTRQDLAATALPVYPYLADGVEGQLADLASNYDRLWFTSDPPADDRDLDGRVPTWLKENLQDVDNESFHARTTIVHSTGYRSAAADAEAVPEDSGVLDLAWPDLPVLYGIETDLKAPEGGSTMWIDLFWQGQTSMPATNTTIRLWLQDAQGDEWARYEQGISDNFNNWPADNLVRESYKLPLPQAILPGSYTLMARPLDGEGQAIGEGKALAELEIAPSPGLAGRPAAIFENGLALKSLDWFDESVHPGHNMSVALIWQTEPGKELPLDDLRYELEVIAPNGEVVRTLGGQPVDGRVEQLPEGAAVREQTAIYFSPESEPGEYKLWWRLYKGDEVVGGRPYWRPWYSDRLIYGTLYVTPWPMDSSLPEDVTVAEAQFGPAIQLYGYELGDTTPDYLPLTLYWLATAKPEESYLIFVHLVDAASGEIVSQVDRVPVDDLRPTSGWRPGEVLSDRLILSLGHDLLPGEYQINVGVYNPDSGERLPLTVDGQRLPDDQITLETIMLP